MNLLRSLVDESKLTQQANQAAVLKLAHEFAFQSIDRTREDELANDAWGWYPLVELVDLSRKLAIDHIKNVSDVLVTRGMSPGENQNRSEVELTFGGPCFAVRNNTRFLSSGEYCVLRTSRTFTGLLAVTLLQPRASMRDPNRLISSC
jgi:hypothetical protein